MLLGERTDAAEAAADDHPNPVWVGAAGLQAGLTASLLCRDRGKLGEPVHTPQLFFLQEVGRVEALDLGGDGGLELLCLERGYGGYAGDSCYQ